MKSAYHGARGVIRRFVLSAPLFMPLFCVVGTLLGGIFLWFSAALLLLILLSGCYRVTIGCVLCALTAYLHYQAHTDACRYYVDNADLINYTERYGTVEKELSNGCVFRDEQSGVRIVLRGEAAQWKAGDCLKVRFELMPVDTAPLQGMFRADTWLRGQGAAATAYCVDAEYIGHPFSFSSLRGMADASRANMARRLIPENAEDDSRAQVLCALLLGDKTHSEPETVNIFKRGGCLHIFAVSGLHVGIIAGIIYILFGRWVLKPWPRTLLVILLTGCYVLMTGMAVPALRAFLMLSLILIGRSLKRPVSMANIWAAAALLILLISPWQLYNAGFLLSFAVYAAIGVGVRFGMRGGAWIQPDAFIPRRIYNKKERRMVSADYWVRGLVMMSLSAWLASLPITAACFHTCNIYGVLTNIAITPLLLPAMGIGLLSLATSSVPYVGALVHAVALQCTGLLLSVVGFFASLPGAYVALVPPQEESSVLVCDVGYGNAVCILGNPGMMINCGNEKAAGFFTEPALFHAGFTPAMLLLTQQRASYSGGESVIRASVTDIKPLKGFEMSGDVMEYSTSAGRYIIVPPSDEISRSPTENHTPVVLWQGSSRSVLFVGNASLQTLERLPRDLMQADIVICGYNPAITVSPKHVSEMLPGADLILLPDAAIFREADLPNKDKVRILRVNEDSPLLLLQ